MVEPGSDLYLSQKPIRTYGCSQFWTEDFDGDLAVVLQILSKIDDRHPPASQLPLDREAVGEGISYKVEEAVKLHS